MKNIFSLILIFWIVFTLLPERLFANSSEGYFVVTAYYSPLPNQKNYLKGNYKDEIRLNGKWIAWASGKKVFSGMLAAPKNYKFGTKIKLEGLWVGSVEDRWGAIVNAWNRGYSYDRIDVWMWHWDEWLRRALNWWKRTVKWTIVSSNTQTTLNYTDLASPKWVTNNLSTIEDIFYKSIWKKSSTQDIKSLKKFLSWIWVYKWEINDNYSNDLISFVYDFQIKHNILNKWYIQGAGYWWKKTRTEFLKQYQIWELEFNINSNSDDNVVINWDKEIIFTKSIKGKSEIIELQNILTKLELYNWEIDWDYKSIQNTILNYQLDNNIIKSIDTLWSWYYWPKTREMLNLDYTKYKEYLIKIENIKLELAELQNEALQKAEKKILDLGSLAEWNISPKVRELQILLKDLGYFDNKDTAIYGNITKNAIIEYQLSNNIISRNTDLWAGNFWPVTKMNLIQTLSDKYYDELFKKKNYDEEIIVKIKNQVL